MEQEPDALWLVSLSIAAAYCSLNERQHANRTNPRQATNDERMSEISTTNGESSNLKIKFSP